MAKIKKKGTSGAAKNFITRSQAVRKLQISLPDFRRLCIFKGIYPREPRNKKKANNGSTANTTFYYTKDIQYLVHEPVLAKFREHKTFAKKLSKALGRGDYTDAKRLEQTHKPVVTLDHIVKERYPTFTDALRDLDDALSMLFLFANLPSSHNLPPAVVASCERLCNEWQHYVIRTNSLRKSFLSIKGIYYQVEVQGQDILWLVPYKFAQTIPADVDFRIMGTFVEFYTTLLGFVMFKLYTNEGLVYPPKFDSAADARGAGLRAFKLEHKGIGALPEAEAAVAAPLKKAAAKEAAKQTKLLQDKIAAITENGEEADEEETPTEENTDTFSTFKPIKSADSTVDVLAQPQISTSGKGTVETTGIFSNMTFYLSRETPREPLEFLLRSFGCRRIGWDLVLGDGSFTDNELDPSITHQVVDRPPVVALPAAAADAAPRGRVPGRTYVQPQYIWDCVNAGRILSAADYAPGAVLPAHLSPWVKVSTGEYDPTQPIAQGEQEEESEEEDDHGMTEDLEEGADEDEMDVEEDEEDEAESDDEEEEARKQHQKELEAEVAGIKLTEEPKKKNKKTKAQREAEEVKEMQKIMMTKKKRKLYEKMQYSNNKKEEATNVLRQKRRKLEKAKKSA
ncbi:ribosome biogenesis protein Pescadillo [Pyronema domesticum]|uniref:Pescadillo homolog n=1 Tax=Pyronema omphalodes (strain CBS 100304) TaxID=1076935 RepID=U4KYV1_PYROM|nr:ribosome biogenesis protein Pescadillo [Pyronema domesticum]CCX06855.1 Similar to Pescadillo homolog; acc. no. Q1DLJ4 [Pyronema omphalodes CBS 100304]